jgi:hypothetical protein
VCDDSGAALTSIEGLFPLARSLRSLKAQRRKERTHVEVSFAAFAALREKAFPVFSALW